MFLLNNNFHCHSLWMAISLLFVFCFYLICVQSELFRMLMTNGGQVIIYIVNDHFFLFLQVATFLKMISFIYHDLFYFSVTIILPD